MTIRRNTITERGYYLVRILVLLSLANLFLYALFSFATFIRLANKALEKNNNYLALESLATNDQALDLDKKNLNCTSKHIADNLEFSTCLQLSTDKSMQFMSERYEEE